MGLGKRNLEAKRRISKHTRVASTRASIPDAKVSQKQSRRYLLLLLRLRLLNLISLLPNKQKESKREKGKIISYNGWLVSITRTTIYIIGVINADYPEITGGVIPREHRLRRAWGRGGRLGGGRQGTPSRRRTCRQ